jgi:hypothetical protein
VRSHSTVVAPVAKSIRPPVVDHGLPHARRTGPDMARDAGIRAYSIIVPREALLVAFTPDVALKCGVDQPKAYGHRPSTDWHACE